MQYWPKRGTQGSYGNLRVTTKSEEKVNDAMCCRKFEITRYVPGGSVRPTAYYWHVSSRELSLCMLSGYYIDLGGYGCSDSVPV